MFGRRRTLSARSSLLMFRIDRPIARISLFVVLYRVPRSGSLLWRRDRNRMGTKLVLKERAVVGSIYSLPRRYSMVQYYITPSVLYTTMNITFT